MSREALAGAWKLVSFQFHRPSGELIHPLGEDAVGSLIYHASGRFAMQISRSARPVFTEKYFHNLDPQEIKVTVIGYFAYFGTYEADPQKKAVTHHVEASLFPNWVGTDQVRHYELNGDSLTLLKLVQADGQERRTSKQVWEKIG